jgi:hypothetical protein
VECTPFFLYLRQVSEVGSQWQTSGSSRLKEIAKTRGVTDQAINKQIGDLEPVEPRSGNRAARYSLDSYIARMNTRPGRRSFDEERRQPFPDEAPTMLLSSAH